MQSNGHQSVNTHKKKPGTALTTRCVLWESLPLLSTRKARLRTTPQGQVTVSTDVQWSKKRGWRGKKNISNLAGEEENNLSGSSVKKNKLQPLITF